MLELLLLLSLSLFYLTMASLENDTGEELEFLSSIDDAWYNVRVELTGGDVLRVRYCGFLPEQGDLFDVNNFRSYDEVNELENRFRTLSLQLQDSECSYAFHGMRVCASYSARQDDVRFYDALIEYVDYHEHSFVNGEEDCLCDFILCWLHGPNAGNLSSASIANICRVHHGPLNNAVVTSFLNRARESVTIRLTGTSVDQEELFQLLDTRCISDIKKKQSFSQRVNQTSKFGDPEREQDRDIGGIKYQHVIFIENLDKGLSPLKMQEFLFEQTSVSSQVYIFPSLSSDPYARGVIIVDCKKNLEKLYTFMDNPDLIIVSSEARPLVVTGKVISYDTFGGSKKAFVLNSDEKSQCKIAKVCSDELKILKSGTKEYNIAKQLKELFMEFIDHQRKLYQTLAVEENNIEANARTVRNYDLLTVKL